MNQHNTCYFEDDDLEHLQILFDNISSEPHKRECFPIKPEGMTFQEIADEMSLSVNMVRQIMDKALKKLRHAA